jgi:transcription antitermination factor NusA-like protein
MKIPLDYVCVRSGLLCNRCESLVNSGQVEQFEVDLMKVLLELEEKEFKELKDSTYHKAYKLDNLLVLVVASGQGMTQYKWIRLAKILQDKFNVKVRIIEKTGSVKDSAIQLLTPVRILGVNMVWLPDGSVQYVIRIPKSERRFLPADSNILESALSKIHSAQVRIKVD